MQKQNSPNKDSLLQILFSITDSAEFTNELTSLLVDLCNIDTVPSENKQHTIEAEEAVYECIQQALRRNAVAGTSVKHPISAQIKTHPAYTKPYYQHDEDYSGRNNLIHIHHAASDEGGIALNAHIDTVCPYFPTIKKNGAIIGRGTSDDKGCCVSIIGALILLQKLYEKTGILPKKPVVSMFVTDEESGGNGSLSVAIDHSLGNYYDTILIVESTEGKLHSANRGAIWYKLDLEGSPETQLRFAFKAVLALNECGTALRNESNHPQFASRPVQTCHGILGAYGEHPARTCGKVVLRIDNPPEQLQSYIADGLDDYIKVYGDRTLVFNADTGKPKIDHHLDIDSKDDHCLLTVWGTAGHMGKALENDSAIVKAAWIADKLYPHMHASQISLEKNNLGTLVLEGGQGFLPTHTIEEVKQRMKNSISQLYNNTRDEFQKLKQPVLSFEKLHNDAFSRSADSKEMELGLFAGRLLHIPNLEPVVGFPVSCDARIFAHEYPDKQVITVGPGTIAYAHTDNEQITEKELTIGALQLALSILLMTGTYVPNDFLQ